MLKLEDFKKMNTNFDNDLLNIKGGLDPNKSYDHYWTHIGTDGSWECYTFDSKIYDHCL